MPFEKKETKSETSVEIRKRVILARERQYERYGSECCNGRVSYETLISTNNMTEKIRKMLQQMAMKKKWSNRVQVKILRLARTISDLRGEKEISEEALWEAMSLSKSQEEQLMNRKKIGVRES